MYYSVSQVAMIYQITRQAVHKKIKAKKIKARKVGNNYIIDKKYLPNYYCFKCGEKWSSGDYKITTKVEEEQQYILGWNCPKCNSGKHINDPGKNWRKK